MSPDEKFERYVVEELADVYETQLSLDHEDVEGMTFGIRLVLVCVGLFAVIGLLVLGLGVWVLVGALR